MKETKEQIFEPEEAEVIVIYPDADERTESEITFWYKDGDETKINRQQFLAFLERKGFRKLYVGKEYLFVQIENNIVKEVGTVHIKDYVTTYIKGLKDELEEDFDANIILGKVINQAPTLFSRNFLEFIPNLDGEFKRDTENESYIYFQNCFVKVTKDGYDVHNYDELEGFIWESQKIKKREFHKADIESVFALFTFRVCKEDPSRFNSLKSAIGYLLHSYKDPANAKAIIFIDERPGEGANGRCGKSLVGKSVGKIRNSVRPDGKNFKFGQFMFQSVKPDTAIIDFNDAKKNFQFENLFSMITDDMPVEKKNKDEVILPFEYSPKILITTNHAIKGVDASTLDREYVLEFSDHYNENHKPIQEFGKKFFDAWNKDEWNSFDNFMISCLQYYLNYGLVEYDRVNLNKKMLIESTSEEFVEFMEDTELGKLYDKKEQHKKFIEAYPDYSKIQQKTFTSWVKLYAKLKGLKFEQKKSGAERGFILIKPENGRMDEQKTGSEGEGDVF